MTDPENNIIVGIDLGTTNSLVAISDEHGPRIIKDSNGESIIPSVVRVLSDGSTVIGRNAHAGLVEFPLDTVYSVKRLMGKSPADIAGDLDYLSYTVVAGEHNTARISLHGKVYSPQEISAMILTELRKVAEDALGCKVHEAVVTVPAYFDDAQRQATRDAGRIAGLEVKRIVNEPTAAALAYGLGQAARLETIAVYDLGGGTFDISILQIVPGEDLNSNQDTTPNVESTDENININTPSQQLNVSIGLPGIKTLDVDVDNNYKKNNKNLNGAFFQVISTAGDTHLGGDDVDRMIVELVQKEIREQFGHTLDFPPSTQQALRKFAEAAKIKLSMDKQANIQVDLGDGRVYQRTINLDEFELMIKPWVTRTIDCSKKAMRGTELDIDNIDRLVMVGGSTRIPLVRKMVGEYFNTEPYTALDPDKVVALGAAIQAAILTGTYKDALLLDVIPLSMGIETMGGAVAKLVMSNSMVPCETTEMFSTSVDGQTSIKIHVLQGEREMAADCRSLGEFHLAGIPPMPAGIPKLDVTFHVDANGILKVSAIEKRSGKRAAIQIVPNHGLSRDEVDRMELESYEFAREDMNLHRIIDLRINSALDLKWIRDRLGILHHQLDHEYNTQLHSLLSQLEYFVIQSEKDPESVDADEFLNAKQALDEASVHLHEISIAASLREDEDRIK